MIIYKATNLIDGRFYIGKTINKFEDRIYHHIKKSLNKKSASTYFHNAIIKHSPDNFKWEVIDSSAITNQELSQLEIKYIFELKPEYNMTRGGEGIVDDTGKIGRKISKALTGRKIIFSEQHKKNLSIAKRGKAKSDAHKLTLSIINKGKRLSDECKIKISESVKAAYARKKNVYCNK